MENINNDLSLRPIHYASVSGGKDSLYMLGLILSNLDKYPLDMVVNFELEIDWPIAKKVTDVIKEKCDKAKIPFVKIKPRKSYAELYKKYGMPNGTARWCNYNYKLDCKKQLEEWIARQACRPIAYIGLCADEEKRFMYRVKEDNWEMQDVCYPLAEEGITEDTVLEWAKTQPVFEDYYNYLDRMGCMFCPFLKLEELAYLRISQPNEFERYFKLAKQTEDFLLLNGYKNFMFRNQGADVVRQKVLDKYVPKLLKKYEKNKTANKTIEI